MIIKALSSETNKIARGTRDLIQEAKKERIGFVPHGIDSLFISIDSKTDELIVLVQNEFGDNLDIVSGFDEIEECWQYARLIAKESGLAEDNIDADVYEID